MKYIEIINELRNKYAHRKISKEDLFDLYKKIYSNDNVKTFENMIGLLKQYEIIIDYSNSYYMIMEKALYRIKDEEDLIKINKIISKEYKNIKTIVWVYSTLYNEQLYYSWNWKICDRINTYIIKGKINEKIYYSYREYV